MLPGTTYDPEVILKLLWSRRWLLAGFTVLGVAAAFGVGRWLPDEYRSEALIMVVPQRIPESYVKATVTERVEDRLAALSERTLSRSRLEQIIVDLNLYKDVRHRETMEETLVRMRKDVKITLNRNDSFLVSYISHDAAEAQKVTERLASLFIQESAQDRESQAENTNQFLDSQLDEAKQRLMDHEKKLELYRRRYSGQLPAQGASNLQVIQSAEAQRQSTADAVNRARERRILIERQLVDLQREAPVLSEQVPGPGGDRLTVLLTPEQRLASARTALEDARAHKTSEHPDVRAAERRLREIEEELSTRSSEAPSPSAVLDPSEALRQRRIKDLTLQLEDIDLELKEKATADDCLRAVIADYQGRLDAMPTRESELVELTRDYTTLQDMYNLF